MPGIPNTPAQAPSPPLTPQSSQALSGLFFFSSLCFPPLCSNMPCVLAPSFSSPKPSPLGLAPVPHLWTFSLGHAHVLQDHARNARSCASPWFLLQHVLACLPRGKIESATPEVSGPSLPLINNFNVRGATPTSHSFLIIFHQLRIWVAPSPVC